MEREDKHDDLNRGVGRRRLTAGRTALPTARQVRIAREIVKDAKRMGDPGTEMKRMKARREITVQLT